jgi:hypothetical protein
MAATSNSNSERFRNPNLANKYFLESLEDALSHGNVFNPFRLILLIG